MNAKNSTHVKSIFLISAFVILAFVIYGIYYFTSKPTSKEAVYDNDYIIFQGKRVNVGDTFNFSPNDSCVEDTKATLVSVTKDSVTLRIKEWNWKNELNTSIEETTDNVIRDNDCINARPVCMDVGYEYCFSLFTIDSIQNITYELKSHSTMPKPPTP